MTKKYKIHYDNDDEDDFNDDIDWGASESNEESDNFYCDDDNNANYEKNAIKQTTNKKKEPNLGFNLTKFYH